MKKYSEFFETLHDEQSPVGRLGRGTHYSVLRAIVFHDVLGNPLIEAEYLEFAVIWDEDHDERVIEPIEKIYRSGLLSRFLMFGERKGSFTAILAKPAIDQSEMLCERLNKITQKLDNEDMWPSCVENLEDHKYSIINDENGKISLYLSNIQMLWELGLKKPTLLKSKY